MRVPKCRAKRCECEQRDRTSTVWATRYRTAAAAARHSALSGGAFPFHVRAFARQAARLMRNSRSPLKAPASVTRKPLAAIRAASTCENIKRRCRHRRRRACICICTSHHYHPSASSLEHSNARTHARSRARNWNSINFNNSHSANGRQQLV